MFRSDRLPDHVSPAKPFAYAAAKKGSRSQAWQAKRQAKKATGGEGRALCLAGMRAKRTEVSTTVFYVYNNSAVLHGSGADRWSWRTPICMVE